MLDLEESGMPRRPADPVFRRSVGGHWRGWAIPLALAATCVLLGVAGAQPARAGTIRGRALDSESRAPVSAAEVHLVGTGLRTLTDPDGRFVLEDVPPGIHTLSLLRLGYRPLRREGVEVPEGETLELELALERRAVELEEITVTPGAYSFMQSGAAARQTMTREDLESVPQLGEDVFRAVNRLPGLSSGDYSAHFSIRGGRHDETLILLDGLELHEPYHLKDFNEGAISIVDVEAIDGVQLMTGGFPAPYGNKRSGVFDIASRTAESDRNRYSVGLSAMNARAMGRGPLRNGRGTWLVSARSGYMDLVFDVIKQNQLPSPRYHDVFAKLQLDLHSRHQLVIDGLHAGDRYTFDAASTSGFRDTLNTREIASNRYGNSYLWGTLRSALGAHTVVRTLVSAGLVTRYRDGSERDVKRVEPFYTLTHDRDYNLYGVKQDWSTRLGEAWAVSFGVDARRFRVTDFFRSTVYQDPNDPSEDSTDTYPVLTDTGFGQSGNRLALYLSNRWRPFAPLVVEAGGRYDRASWTGDRDFSPRVSAAVNLGARRTLRLGWGQYRQIQGIDDVAALNDGRRYFPSELSVQWTAGLEQTFAGGALLRVEGYLKQGSNLRPVYRNWKGGIDTFPEVNEDRLLVFPRETTARGVEVYYDRKLAERFALRASYAWSIAREKVDRIVNVNTPGPPVYDPEHPIPQDQRHAANLDFTYRWRRAWSINGSLAFHSGWPATLEHMIPIVTEDGRDDFSIQPLEIYGERLPSYLRCDVRATRRWTTSRGDMRFFVELVNLTNHANIFGYDYYKTPDAAGNLVLGREDETWFTVLPSIGVAWSTGF